MPSQKKSSGKLIISTQRMLRKKKERKTGYSRLSCLLTDPYTPNPTPLPTPHPLFGCKKMDTYKSSWVEGLKYSGNSNHIWEAQCWHFLNFVTGRWGRGRECPTPKKIEIEMKKNGRFLLEAAIVEYLRPWEIISNYESNKSRVIKNQAIWKKIFNVPCWKYSMFLCVPVRSYLLMKSQASITDILTAELNTN